MTYELSYKTLRDRAFVQAVHKVVTWTKYSTPVRVRVVEFWKPVAEAGEICDGLLKDLAERKGKKLPNGTYDIPDDVLGEFHKAHATINGPKLKSKWLEGVELSPADIVGLGPVIE